MKILGLLSLALLAAACGSVPNDFADASSAGCDDHNPCTVDGSDASGCTHTAGNPGTVCREAAGDCDVAEVCDGTSDTCPTDELDTGSVCRAAIPDDPCDVPETCAGDSPDCPAETGPRTTLVAGVGGLGSGGTSPAGDLFAVSITDGSVTDIGPIGFAVTGMSTQPGTGIVFATSTPNSPTSPSSLIMIDPLTGAGTLIGATGNTLADIAFASDGRLFGWSESGDDLTTVDPATGATTHITDTSINSAGSGLTFDASDNLWFAGNFSGSPNPGGLDRLDTSTGQSAQFIAGMTGIANAQTVSALATDPRTGTIYALVRIGSGGGTLRGIIVGTRTLATLDTSTGVLTAIGDTGLPLDAMTFACRPPS